MINLSIGIQGVEVLIRELDAKRTRAMNMKPVLTLVGRDFRRVMVLQFDSAGRYLGTAWAPLAEATLERKARAGSDQRILHATKRLRKSFTTGQEGVFVSTADSLEIGSAVPYSGYVSDGTSRMPARPIVTIGGRERRRWNKAMTRYLNKGVLRMEI